MIQKEDVLSVAKDLHMSPTEEQIQYCIDNIDGMAEDDPTGDWVLWTEQLLRDQDVAQETPPKKFQYFLFDITTGETEMELGMLTHLEAEKYEGGSLRVITEHQLLVEKAIIEIRNDVASGDVTAIEGLLQLVPKKLLIDFLPEKL
jgi:hypothetical protein